MIPIIIPSYEPDDRLIELLKDLKSHILSPVILVNDGSGKEYDNIFESAKNIIESNGGIVLNHDNNRGKGRALKTAFKYVMEKYPDAVGVVTADSDGQHTYKCIKSVSDALSANNNKLILGVRDFNVEGIPWKSRFGNRLTEKIFLYVAGMHISDTQTGLRGIPFDYLKELLNVKGDRFEFETRMLLDSAGKYEIIEVPIETVYESENNHKTHFNPIVDSIKIYRILGAQFIRFLFSSLSSSLVDLGLFALLCYLLKSNITAYIVVSTVIARIVSATYNFVLNYKLVFKSKAKIGKSGAGYFLLAVVQMLMSAAFVTLFSLLLPFIYEVVIKAVVDVILFFVSYKIQKKYVF